MATESREGRYRRDLPGPEFTTRPRRLLMIGRIQPGHESGVLEAHEQLPVEAAAAAGIDAIEAFLGSGHYALMLEIEGDDAQEALAAYLNDPRVQAFHALLQPLVTGFPSPEAHYGPQDHLHLAGAAPAASEAVAYRSADLPLAASIFRWVAGDG